MPTDDKFLVHYTCSVLSALVTHVWLKLFDPVPLSGALSVLAIVPFIQAYYTGPSSQSFGYTLVQTYILFLTALTVSVCAYRLSPFHPLAQYPGPVILRVTKLYSAWLAYKGETYLYLKRLHDEYGPTVRIGPTELSTIEKDLIPQILGNHGMPKGHLWDGRRFSQAGDSKGYDTLIDARHPDVHPQLRKPWSKAFSAEPMRDYTVLLALRVTELVTRLKDQCQESEDGIASVDIAEWITYFSYDFMGDFAFSGDYHYMRDKDKDGNVKYMGESIRLMAATQNAVWISKLVHSTPYVNSSLLKFIDYCLGQAMKRSSIEVKRKDLFYHMGEAAGTSVSDLPLIVSNVILAIVAGSDTTASVLSNAIYLLVSHPAELRRLQEEVDPVFKDRETWEAGEDESQIFQEDDTLSGGMKYNELPVGGLEFLNAVINETLRLFPAVPTNIQRAPPKGTSKLLQDGNTNILLSDSTSITVPPYALHRDPRHFSPHPDRFIPDRWLPNASSKGYITSREAFIPFSAGPQNCAGRALALLELRFGLAALVRNFDMEFDSALRNDPGKWERELKDWFTMGKGALEVKLKRRKI